MWEREIRTNLFLLFGKTRKVNESSGERREWEGTDKEKSSSFSISSISGLQIPPVLAVRRWMSIETISDAVCVQLYQLLQGESEVLVILN